MSPKFLFFIVLALFLATVSAGIIRERRQAYYTPNGAVVNNMVSDGLFGGPTSLGWAQVPHVYSPMFSPVFGK
ncbi:Nematode Specific Peptide family, group E [Caenorhabditis elegans]|uniref:Nematode Specific Peptide family, group E n=1 Tax=Caenorhabditis elegans TaxID=6239 RepID=Q9NAJ9_CAEEL|nr:Nematode Specific Peptide family, group E [Caenorhabditis elegans]CAB54403.1 Nematode Specific Peptide family, group E [Caenorhabditis elegans]|eukprot:NP_496695.1 Nematode Specific Peptide family, group E [Caenorhabditis elegans]